MEPLGAVSFEPGPICRLHLIEVDVREYVQAREIYGAAGVCWTLRLNEARNSFCKVGRETVEFGSRDMIRVVGRRQVEGGQLRLDVDSG